MTDPRLQAIRSTVKPETCVMIPAGTEITLCAEAGKKYGDPGIPSRRVTLATSWFVSVADDVRPEVILGE